MNRTLLALVGTGLLLVPTLGHADDVDALSGKVTALDARVYELNSQLKPPPGPGPEIAENRLIDAQVLYELKNYEAASIILFDVVDKYPTSAAYPEALFYLADSLYLKRDFLSSRRYFEKIVDVGPSTARYPEALQRLIELSLHTGDYSPVDGYIAKLQGLTMQKPLPSVPYVEGKYYYFRRQFDKSLEILRTIGQDHPYYFHALYFVGADYVAMGPTHLDDALGAFGAIVKAPAQTDSQKRIAELAHMAMARIYLDRSQLTQSLDEYSKIGAKSDSFNEMLYESAWVAIKGKDFVRARRQLDLLLLNAPDSSLAPEVKLLIGNLSVRQGDYGKATDAFTKTRDEYQPIHDQLEAEIERNADPKSYFRDLIAKNLSHFDINLILPETAARWVREAPEVTRVATLIDDENELRKSLDESDEIVTRLEKVLSSPARVNVFPELAEARARVTTIGNELTDVKKQLAEKQAQLLEPVAGAQKSQLDQLDQERKGLEAKLTQLPVELAGVTARQDKARAAYNNLDKQASELNAQLAVLSQAVSASEKLYEQAARQAGTFQPIAPPSVAPTPSQAVAATYTDEVQALDGRLKQTTDQVSRLRARVDLLKDAVLKSPVSVKSELEGCALDAATAQAGLDGVRRDLLDAAANIGVGDADMQAAQQLKSQYEGLLKRQHDLSVEIRSRLGSGERAKSEQIESILDRARAVDQKIADFNGRIDGLLDSRLKDIQGTLAEEKTHVVGFRETLGGYNTQSAQVGGGIVADNFKQVAARFYNIVVRSDVGIIDVAWALKDSSTRETNKLVAERKRELKLLDDEFKDVLKEHP